MGELRQLLPECKLHVGSRGAGLFGNNSLLRVSPLLQTYLVVLFYFIGLIEFCKWLTSPTCKTRLENDLEGSRTHSLADCLENYLPLGPSTVVHGDLRILLGSLEGTPLPNLVLLVKLVRFAVSFTFPV